MRTVTEQRNSENGNNLSDKHVNKVSMLEVRGQGHCKTSIRRPTEGVETFKNNNTEYSSLRGGTDLKTVARSQEQNMGELKQIFDAVTFGGRYNYQGARRRVPSGLNVAAWREYLRDYEDTGLVDYLEFGWPIAFSKGSPLVSTYVNHASALQFPKDIQHYINTEMKHGALAGPFEGPPVNYYHASPLMTRPKRDAAFRRVIVDLSWPPGTSVNDGIPEGNYVDGLSDIKLPTVEYMESRLLKLGPGAFMYKTDLSRGYRQLRVDPTDWPLLGFTHQGKYYMDLCPPFGLRTSALFMQRTSEAICHIHLQHGFVSRPYLDDFGGAEKTKKTAEEALERLQNIMAELGVSEALHKVAHPAQQMVWLGLLYDSVAMTISIPGPKLKEIGETMRAWKGKTRATQREMQSVLGTLQFVAGVCTPARVFTNRMLQNLREAPKRGTESLSLGFKQDLEFFIELLPKFNGIKILDKKQLECQDELELDSCLTGCGAYNGSEFYATRFPAAVLDVQHCIAHLELLNVVVALKVWRGGWRGRRVRVACDNTNACLAINSGRSKDPYIQSCVRELFLYCAAGDIELRADHTPGRLLTRADALSRAHTGKVFRDKLNADTELRKAKEVRVPEDYFMLNNKL